MDTHAIKTACKHNCYLRCSSKIDNCRRTEIHREYWTKTKFDRENFIHSACKKQDAATHTSTQYNESQIKKKFVYHYSLPDNRGIYTRVCKIFFLTTLGYKPGNDSIIQTVVGRSVDSNICHDQRGKFDRREGKFDRQLIINHIESYHPQVSHYRREHAPNIRCLPNDVTIHDMWNDFNNVSNIKISYSLYQQTLSIKIFTLPGI